MRSVIRSCLKRVGGASPREVQRKLRVAFGTLLMEIEEKWVTDCVWAGTQFQRKLDFVNSAAWLYYCFL